MAQQSKSNKDNKDNTDLMRDLPDEQLEDMQRTMSDADNEEIYD